ncbi:MAG: PP2C family protein-serine/threonine phosphatase, partial [Ardenticatenaceae bacterium]
QTLLHYPAHGPLVADAVWEWVKELPEAHYFLAGEALPWGDGRAARTAVALPIVDVERTTPIGGLYLVLSQWGTGPVRELLPAAQALAAQIASALHSAEVYERTLAHQKVEQELALAGTIQASFLPRDLPDIAGWEFAVWIAPARQTSGDFCDWIALPGGRLAIVIADVADKGLGAALFMALSRTLIRTYAVEHHERPELALAAANQRILSDTNSSMFVTAFFGVLDPTNGILTYCNAGHNPPYMLNGQAARALGATGLPLGILEELTWNAETLHFAPGDALLLYTDGITEAGNLPGDFFGTERLLAVAQSTAERSAHALQDAITDAVFDWIGPAPQFDDMTMMVLVRGAEPPPGVDGRSIAGGMPWNPL